MSCKSYMPVTAILILTSIGYNAVAPTTIRVGQIVELQMGFGAILTKKRKHVLVPVLRSICILDRTLQEVRICFSTGYTVLHV